jgi:DNA polymerase
VPTINNCLGCPYHGRAIGPRGDPTSHIVLVGEAPGAKEIDEGQPFVGAAGKRVLWPALLEARLSEAALFITNAVACRPHDPARPTVREPSPQAILACHGRLVRDIAASPRAVVVALGVTAVQAVTGQRGFPMMEAHGTELPSIWGPIVPTFHPAFVLRRGLDGPGRRSLVADLEHARRLAGT